MQVFECILKLIRYKATNDNIKDLEKVLVYCINDGDSLIVNDRTIYLNGTIDVDKLAESVVWLGTHKEELGS